MPGATVAAVQGEQGPAVSRGISMLLNCKCTDSADTSEEQLEQPPITSGSSCSCFLMDFQTADGVGGCVD